MAPATPGGAVLSAAADRARAVDEVTPGDAGVAAVTFVAEVVASLWLERNWTSGDVDELCGDVAAVLRRPVDAVRLAVFLAAVQEPRLLELPPRLTIETRLRMLQAFAPLEEISLWARGLDSRLVCALVLGPERPSRQARQLAQAVLDGERVEEPGERTTLHALPILRWEQPHAALVVRWVADGSGKALLFAHEVARTLASPLEMDALLERSADRERSLVDSSERRLVRLGFDLHDGPMQDIAALTAEVRDFRGRLGDVATGEVPLELVRGRLDDLEARLRTLGSDLREISKTLNSPVALRIPLEEVVGREVQLFEQRTGIRATVAVSGDFERLSVSQRIVVMRVLQETLANVQHHSGATSVNVVLDAGTERTAMVVEDDGGGFAVEETLVDAARGGRLGLVGMSERIRLLGGRFDVVSRPGGPTRVSATLPRWQPVSQDGDAEDG